jgi:hypothetical protein
MAPRNGVGFRPLPLPQLWTKRHIEQHLDNLRRKGLLPRLKNDRSICLLGWLFCLELCRFCYTTPPSAACSARCAPAGASLQTSTADPEELHRSDTLSRSGTTRWRTREEKRPNRLTIPRDALLARLSSFRLLAIASSYWMLVGNS